MANQGPRLQGVNVLVVEDESLVLMLAEDFLDEAGANVSVAMNLGEALQMARSAPLDCAVLDINLGQGDTSHPVAEVLLEREIPFAFVSGYNRTVLGEAWAGYTVLQKPYDKLGFLAAVKRCLELSYP